jgi:type II restriction/modification system DNA methylase subunit YeeA
LVCYWFERARTAIQTQGLGAAGFVATQSIRHGLNREVLDAIASHTRIYEAWSDEPWVNDGAAVRVALVAFGRGECCHLDGQRVNGITPALTSIDNTDTTTASALKENADRCFQGSQKIGDFDVPGDMARQWLLIPNLNGKSSAAILKPYCNGIDITRRNRDMWIVDFGLRSTEQEAMLFEAPFQYAHSVIKPERERNPRESRAKYWWRHGDGQPAMRAAIAHLPRYIATPETAKHRIFSWLHGGVLPDKKLIVIAAHDDMIMGVLSSRIHEVWALAQVSIHGDGKDGGRPRYTPTTCFETFPFPAGLTPADTAYQRTQTLSSGALIPGSFDPRVFRAKQAISAHGIFL